MSAAESIVRQARELGITLRLVGDRIRYTPKDRVPPELVETLRSNKAELAEFLRTQERVGTASGEERHPGGDVQERLGVPGTGATSGADIYLRVMDWAGDDPVRWQWFHKALLRIQHPVWEKRNGRDELVSWAAANLKLCQARRELERFGKMRYPLKLRDNDAKNAREADVSFWGRLAERQAPRAAAVLAEDTEAAAVLMAVVTKYSQNQTGRGGSGHGN